jgi:hypothetical protein
MAGLTTAEPEEKGFVYYGYDTDGGTGGGYYEPKHSSLPYLEVGTWITLTYSRNQPRGLIPNALKLVLHRLATNLFSKENHEESHEFSLRRLVFLTTSDATL